MPHGIQFQYNLSGALQGIISPANRYTAAVVSMEEPPLKPIKAILCPKCHGSVFEAAGNAEGTQATAGARTWGCTRDRRMVFSETMLFHILIGTANWSHPEFVRDWYPKGLPARERRRFYQCPKVTL